MELLSSIKLAKHFIRQIPRWLLAVWMFSSLLLALTTSAYGFLVGPLLRIAFNGGLPELPQGLESFLPTLSIQQLRQLLPWAIALVSLLKGLAYFVEKYSLASLSTIYSHSQRTQLLEQISNLSIDTLQNHGQGILHNFLTNDIEKLEHWVIDGWAPIIRDGLQIIALALTALLVSGEVGIWVLLIYPTLMIPLLSLRRRLKYRTRGELKEFRQLSQWTHDYLQRVHILKVYDPLQKQQIHFRQLQQKLRVKQLARAKLVALTPPLTELTSAFMIAIGLGWFLEGVTQGRWQAEQLISLFVCLIMMYAPLKSISKANTYWIRAQDVLTAFTKVHTSMTEHLFQKEIHNSTPSHFHWQDLVIFREQNQLSPSVSFCVTRGKITGIIGNNGIGKSSLIYQILGLNPNVGKSKFFMDHQEYQPSYLLKNALVSWLPQGSLLPIFYAGELKQILAQAQSEFHLKLRHSLRVTELFEMIMMMPDHERLDGLSGGERQKCLLYLCLSSSSPLVILDEPEAHLDHETVLSLAQMITQIRHQKAWIMISHHPILRALYDEQLELKAS